MTTYRFPASLGGGEHEAADDEDSSFHLVAFELEGVSERMWLPRKDLVEVKPPLPEEPPPLSVVQIGASFFERRDTAGIDWWDVAAGTWLTWAQVCSVGTPTRLVPEPVELPPGGEAREEFGVSHLNIETGRRELTERDSREEAERSFEHFDQVWGHHTRLMRRTVHTGPWREVEEADRG